MISKSSQSKTQKALSRATRLSTSTPNSDLWRPVITTWTCQSRWATSRVPALRVIPFVFADKDTILKTRSQRRSFSLRTCLCVAHTWPITAQWLLSALNQSTSVSLNLVNCQRDLWSYTTLTQRKRWNLISKSQVLCGKLQISVTNFKLCFF